MAAPLTGLTIWNPFYQIFQSILNFWRRWFQKASPFPSDLFESKKVSPQELFEEKLANEEYEEALEIAIKHKFNTDVVYQRQWANTPITLESIDTVLRKVKDTKWIIDKCIHKVPAEFDSCQALLEYGLLVVKEELESLENEREQEEKEEAEDDENDDGGSGSESSDSKANEEDSKLLRLEAIDLEQKRHLVWKYYFIKYLKRLKTYKIILDTNDKRHCNFSDTFFKQFRSESGLESCINFARSAKWRSVEVMFNSHPQETLEHWLPILSNFPETIKPRYYNYLLPFCCSPDESNQVQKWHTFTVNETEVNTGLDKELMEKLTQYDNLFEVDFYFNNPNLIEFKTKQLTPDLVSKWFLVRAREIDKYSSKVSNSVELLQIGQEHNVPGLDKLKEEFETYSTLIYHCFQDVNKEIDFDDFEKLDIHSKINLLMSGALKSADKFIANLHDYLIPFLKKSFKSPSEEQDLLWNYLETVSKTHLDIVQNIFINYHTASEFGVIPEDDIIQNDENLIKLTLRCIYANQKSDHLNESFNIVECLPEKNADVFVQHPDLDQKVNHMYKQLEVVELLEQYNCRFTVQEIDRIQFEKDEDKVKKLMHKILRNFSKKFNSEPSSIKENDWLQLFDDLQNIRTLCFVDFLSLDDLYIMFVTTLLGSGRSQTFGLATSFMQLIEEPGSSKRKKLIPFKLSIELIIEATKNYINSANSICDDSVELAQECLKLIDPDQTKNHPIISQEVNFIKALSILSSEFDLKILPIQLRLMEDPKLDIIFQAMSAKAKSYKKVDKLLNLAHLLNIYSEEEESERNAKILSFIGNFTFEKKDYKQCWNVCKKIVLKNYSSGWKLCHRLGRCDLFENKSAKLDLLSFALTYCNVDSICSVLASLKELKIQLLQESLTSSSSYTDGLKIVTSLPISMAPIDFTFQLIKLSKREEEEGKEETKSQNAETVRSVKSINLPSFYSDAFKAHSYFIISLNSLDYDYLKINSSSNNQNADYKCASKYQLLLRMSLLEKESNSNVIIEYLKQLAFYSFSYDTQLAISCLLALGQEVNEMPFTRFDNKSSILVFLALYYYSILVCKENQIDLDLTKSTVREVISKADQVLQSHSSSKYQALVEKYYQLYCKCLQSETLISLNPNVDLDRFESDCEYQRDTILGLALTRDDKTFNILVDLAHQYSIVLWDLYLTHFEYLITDPEVDVEMIAAKVFKDSQFIDVLKENQDEVQNYFETRIYPLLNGLDHNRLVLCHQIIEKTCFSLLEVDDDDNNEAGNDDDDNNNNAVN